MRVDDGVREGDAISPFYDSMIAKLIVHGDTREQALARLDAALAQTQIVGLSSNVQFLRHVVKSEAFAQAKLDTALIEREKAVLFQQTAVPTPLAVAIAVAQQMSKSYRESLIGTTQAVLFEEQVLSFYTGHAPNYVRVYAAGEELHNVVKNVKITGLYEDGVFGLIEE